MTKRKVWHDEQPAKRVEQQPKYVKNASKEVNGTLYARAPLPKYKLTGKFKMFLGEKVFQIQALRNFDTVQAGDFGGYIQSEHNLSHSGLCWVAQRAVVCHQAQVLDNAWAMDASVVKESATLRGNAYIFDRVTLRGTCNVEDNVVLHGDLVVGGKVHLRYDLELHTSEELTAHLKNKGRKL